jgi:hypothetical protein
MAVKMASRLGRNSKIGCQIRKIDGEKIVLTEAVRDVQSIVERIDEEIARRSAK